MGDIIELVLTLLWGGGKVFWAAAFLPASENSTVRARGKRRNTPLWVLCAAALHGIIHSTKLVGPSSSANCSGD